MAKYRKKPVVIDAVRWTGAQTDWEAVTALGGDAVVLMLNDNRSITIPTLEGDMRAEVGDWIIKGVKGELYPCKPDIFAATYEPA